MWTIVSVENCPFSSQENFLSALEVLVNRPNILNDRVICAKVLETCHIDQAFSNAETFDCQVSSILKLVLNLRENPTIAEILPPTFLSQKCFENFDIRSAKNGTVVCRRRQFPKLPERFSNFEDVVLLDIQGDISVMFIPLINLTTLQDKEIHQIAPTFPFSIRFKKIDKIITLEVLGSDMLSSKVGSATCHWLKDTVFKSIVKWSNQEQPSTPSLSSLTLVPVDKYCEHRHRLKTKYAKDIIGKWTESTDPQKFVHEDIAIAAYLLTLWEQEREDLGTDQKQSFVDLGCGNGLLVYILSSEGHKGFGLDIRKRSIWDSFNSKATLVESTIIPSQEALFPEHDWLIGNHSDELTPWIPMIAARSSYKMRVFLLPCCAFTFDGKFQRTFPGSSQYQSFLNFVEDLCQVAGLNVQRDKLRIPSTKRICFVCSSRSYSRNEEAEIEEKRKAYIIKHSRVPAEDDFSDHKNLPDNCEMWTKSFIPRVKVEAVRNCTQLDRSFLDDTVNTLAQTLLSMGRECRDIQTKSGTKSYLYGGSLTIGELAEKLDSKTKLKLKQQCGGLQTLLRNHRHIFQILDGQVSVTTPLSRSDNSKVQKKKNNAKKGTLVQRPCWFHYHHPQGCILEEEECRFLHH